ncbi:MAG: bifunctional YncE family protein/alkaline phosphatase family protein [Bryobacterales bacterium]|nr:bifunctional YncE family protein/alkaline phosphatase family protein [Bryobacterales bacterium]
MRQFSPLPALLTALIAFAVPCAAQHYTAPAGERPAAKRLGAESILPGGRLITPLGRQHVTGASPVGIAVSPNGKRVATADAGADQTSVTVFSRSGPSLRRERFESLKVPAPDGTKIDGRGYSQGIAFEGNNRIYVSEGHSGRVRLMDAGNGDLLRTYSLNQGEFRTSYSAGLALDPKRKRLYVADLANLRLAVFDLGSGRVTHSVRLDGSPLQISLTPDKRQAFVTGTGFFDNPPIPEAKLKNAPAGGPPIPAGSFSLRSAGEAAIPRAQGDEARNLALGDPGASGTGSVTVVDLSNDVPKVVKRIHPRPPSDGKAGGGGVPSGVLVTEEAVYVSTWPNDEIAVIDRATLTLSGEIPLRIPGLESFRGILPGRMAFDAASNRLYVAEAGINAVAVIDPAQRKVLGHLPVGWFPTDVQIHEGNLYVVNAKGQGTGPNASREEALPARRMADFGHGTLSVIPLPEAASLAAHTAQVMANNGFIAAEGGPAPIPEAIKHVVLIVKEGRTYDEVFGDMGQAANGPVNGAPALARIGNLGFAEQDRSGLVTRKELKDIPITPNHRALAERFAFSDNFYCDSGGSVDGHHGPLWPWALPGRQTHRLSEEQPEAGALWRHLDARGVTYRIFGAGPEWAGIGQGKGETPDGRNMLTNASDTGPLSASTSPAYPGFNMNIPDQYRAGQFIAEIEKLYRKPGKELPRFIYIRLPNDRMSKPRPEDGYPFRASFVADNDLALGRIVEYLSKSPWWKEMTILVTEGDARGGVDHVDSHRSILLAVSPFARRNYASHRNIGFPGLLKTVFRILGVPPLNLLDASAADLGDCFTVSADFRPYELRPVRKDLFDPEVASGPIGRNP